ncbi:hypothetical protein [uncultured Sphingomonas sp.]|uniref:hypothetical protein n=1 Tax=uncultured Sphingomonas sp. TaxID=158754 RepID=UPI002617F84F|nr:hypothetical protein [uncultured Sphingomonas sp.]
MLWFRENRTGQKRRTRHGGKKSSTTHDGYSPVLVRILTKVPDKYKVYPRVSGLQLSQRACSATSALGSSSQMPITLEWQRNW